MTAPGSVDLAIEGARGRAVRVPRRTYWVSEPDVVDVWVVDSETLLPPFRQFVISATNHHAVGYLFKIAAVDPTCAPARPADGAVGVGFVPPIATRTFTGEDQTARDLCRMIAGNLVDGRLPMDAGQHMWELVIAATVHLIEQARSEAPVCAFERTGAAGAAAARAMTADCGETADHHEAYRSGFRAGEMQACERVAKLITERNIVTAERDELREEIDRALEALEDADPVMHGPPLTIAQRIRALGDRARTITDMLAGASERLARHNANPGKPDTPVGIFMAGTRGIGGTIGVLRDVAAERQRAEAKFPDEHLPDGTGPDVILRDLPAHQNAVRLDRFAEWARARCQANGPDEDNWLAVLLEEVGEAFTETDPADLRAELVQVAAVAVRWVEDIDLRAAGQADAA